MNQLALAIPNYNGAHYLKETLLSLASQRPHVRWHLQDAGSTDGSAELASLLAGPHDTVLVEKDNGQPDGLNKAFEKMGGEIIGWINSDDLLADGAAEAVLACFADHPDIDIVYGNVEWIGADGESLGLHSGKVDSLRDILDIYGVWWNGLQWVQPEVFFRRALYEKVQGINPRYDLAFDFDLWVRMFEAGARTKKIPKTLARFRLHDAQKSRRSREAADEIRAIIRSALARKPPVPGSFVRKLRRCLEYDCYQVGDHAAGKRLSLGRALASHPHWLLVPEVRRRILSAIRRRLGCGC